MACFRRILMSALAMTGLVAGVGVGVGTGAGCSNKLETGYDPVRLGATPQQRRGYYAPPFSPEARAAPDRDDALESRRPRPGY